MTAQAILADAQLDYRLRALNESYAACVDEGEIEGWPAFFTQDALYRITSRENHSQGLTLSEIYCVGIGMIQDRAVAIRKTTVFEVRTTPATP